MFESHAAAEMDLASITNLVNAFVTALGQSNQTGCKIGLPHDTQKYILRFKGASACITGGGAIIKSSLIYYSIGNAGYLVYATTKSAITGFTRSLARELESSNIRVNAVLPDWVNTERQKDLFNIDDGSKSHLSNQFLSEPLVPNNIVGKALFLASNASRIMTGRVLVLDGGVVLTV